MIGSGGALTRGILIGDTRVTLADPDGRPIREFDGVQKIHAVAGNIALGFAGNIDVGFSMVGDLALMVRNSVPPGYMTHEPSRLLFKWARRIRHHWSRLPSAHQRGGCELIYVAARPPHSVIGVTSPVVWVLRAQEDFEPEPVPWMDVVSIGSGSDVAEYAAALASINADRNVLLTLGNPTWDGAGGPLIVMSAVLGQRIRELAVPGISHHLVLCSVRWGEVSFGTNEGVGFTPEERSEAWPPIARTWNEWQSVRTQLDLGSLLAIG